MAGNAVEPAKDVKEYLVNFNGVLSTAKDSIMKKIESVLIPVKFETAMETYSGYLSKEMPESVWKKIFGGKKADNDVDVDDGGNQGNVGNGLISLGTLALYELVMICQTLPPLKRHFGRGENLSRLMELLQDVHAEFFLKDNNVTDIGKVRQRGIESKLMAVLDELSLDVEWKESDGEDGCDNVLDTNVPLFYEETVRKIERKMQSKAESEYTEEERVAMKKIVDNIRQERRNDGFPNSDSTFKANLINAFKHNVKCVYCERIPKDVRTLPCLHLSCSACLKSHITDQQITAASSRSSVDKQSISCPVCYTRLSMPSVAHVDHLPAGFITEALVKLHDSISSGPRNQSALECRLCFNSEPTYICFQCSDFYCRDHTAEYYSKHGDINHDETITSLSSLGDIENVTSWLHRFCPQHHQHLTHFCSGCKVPLCSHMLCVDWHSQHADPAVGLYRMDEAIQDEKKKIIKLQASLQKKMEKIRAKMNLAEKNQISVAGMQENVRQSIEKYFAEIEENLAKQKASFLSDLDKASSQCYREDEQICARLKAWTEKTTKLETDFRPYLENPDTDSVRTEVSVPEMASFRYRILQQLSDACTGALVATPKRVSYPESRLSELYRQICTLQSNITTASSKAGWESLITFPTGLGPGAIGAPLHFVVDSQKKFVYTIKGSGLVVSCQVLSYDLKQVEKRTPNVLADAKSHSFESMAMDQTKRRLFVAEEPQSLLGLPNMRLKKFVPVRLYEFNTLDMVTQTRILNIDQLNIYGKSIIKCANGRLYVCDGMCICEFDPSDQCKLLRKFNFHNMLEITDFAVEPKRDFLYVADAKKHSLLIFDCERQSVRSIGERGITPGRFDQPASISVDEYGHVFVADAGNVRVQIFDGDGRFLRLLQYPMLIKCNEYSLDSSKLKEGSNSTPVKVALHAIDDCLYLCDSRSAQLWRFRYL